MAEPPRRQRNGDGEGDAIGQAEQGTEADSSSDATEARAKRSPADRGDHQRQRCEIEQDERDQRARNDRGEHQGRRSAGDQGYEHKGHHQLSRSLRAVRGVSPQPSATGRPGSLMRLKSAAGGDVAAG